MSVVSINVCGYFIYLYGCWVISSFYSCLYGWCAIHNGFMYMWFLSCVVFSCRFEPLPAELLVVQLVERSPREQSVVGSNPT